ncbi:glycoside hydrolase family 26 protein [Mycobacterium sp. 141]|uniref:glycoside hydrolase family 26 protein n=1 Tax=Mycobacterium sp. 141 TaxID=1120797 RepID=UPI0018C9923B|nr:glycosyl hydrolase [Mycobacterium sp. 141]
MPNDRAGVQLSRRALLSSIPAASLVLMVGGCRKEADVKRVFGLAANGLDAAAIDQASATGRTLGRRLDVLTVYEAFAWKQPLPVQLLKLIEAAGSVPEITWEPWNPEDGPRQPLYGLGQIAGGRYDSYIASWAKAAAEYQGRLLLRFAHEMNGDWYPWSVSSGGGTPEDYVAAYRRVRLIFQDAGANRVEWVWSPNVIVNGDADAVRRAYPGDDLVDIVGIDGYNFGNRNGHRWTSPEELFGVTLDVVASIAPNTPVWINEVGCSDAGGNKAQWITDFFSYVKTTSVRGVLWFEVDKTGESDWRLTETPETTAAAKAALADW